MSSVVIAGDTSGSVTLQAPAVAGTTVINLPSTTGTIALTSNIPSAATPTALGTVYGSMTNAGASPYLTAVGYFAGNSNTGGGNSAFGWGALYNNSSGADNTSVGMQSMVANTTGSSNVAVGKQALQANTTGAGNTGLGYRAGVSITTGVQNTFVGQNAGVALTTGNNNIAIGGVGTFGAATGDTNTIVIGAYSGGNLNGGDKNTIMGYNVSASSATVTNELVIASGTGAVGKGANTGFISPSGGGVYQGNNSATWSVTSDQRLKKNIVNNDVGLEKLTQIQVRNFEYRTEEEVTELPTHAAIKKEGVQLGVIAQELQAVLPECVKTESTGVMTVDQDNLTWYLINAVKELSARIAVLEGK